MNIDGVRDNCISGSAQDTATSTEKIAFYFTIRAHKSTHKNSFLPNAQLRQELHDVDCQIVAARARYHSRGFLDDTNTVTTLRSTQVRMTPRQARLGTSRRRNYCCTWQDKARTVQSENGARSYAQAESAKHMLSFANPRRHEKN